MLSLIQSKAAQGDLEALNTLAFLQSIGFIKDEPQEPKPTEPKTWELLDQCRRSSNRYQKSA